MFRIRLYSRLRVEDRLNCSQVYKTNFFKTVTTSESLYSLKPVINTNAL